MMKTKNLLFENFEGYQKILEEIERYDELKLDIMLEGLIDNNIIKEKNLKSKELQIKNQKFIDSLKIDSPLLTYYKALIMIKDSEFLDRKNKSSNLNVKIYKIKPIKHI